MTFQLTPQRPSPQNPDYLPIRAGSDLRHCAYPDALYTHEGSGEFQVQNPKFVSNANTICHGAARCLIEGYVAVGPATHNPPVVEDFSDTLEVLRKMQIQVARCANGRNCFLPL